MTDISLEDIREDVDLSLEGEEKDTTAQEPISVTPEPVSKQQTTDAPQILEPEIRSSTRI